MAIRKFGTGDGQVLGTPLTEDDDQGISRTAQVQVEREPWTSEDAEALAQENRER